MERPLFNSRAWLADSEAGLSQPVAAEAETVAEQESLPIRDADSIPIV
jgi:hypothetical protein